MLKRYGTFMLAGMAANFLLTGPVGAATAEPNKPALEQEVQELKKKLTDVQGMLDELDARVGDTEKHSTTDRLLWNVDLRTELNSLHYQDALVMPEFAQVMLGLWAFDRWPCRLATLTCRPILQGTGIQTTPLTECMPRTPSTSRCCRA